MLSFSFLKLSCLLGIIIFLRHWKGGPSIPYPFNYFEKYPISLKEIWQISPNSEHITPPPHIPKNDPIIPYPFLSHDVASGSEITPCNKIDKPLVVYRFTGNVMTSIITLRKRWQNLDVFTPKKRFLISYNVRCHVINRI